MIAIDALALIRLLQFASPALPVGAYSYSQGMESAIEDGIVRDAGSAESWIRDVLWYSVGSFEAPVLWRMFAALEANDYAELARWNSIFRAGRETAELRAETLQMGHALGSLIKDLALFENADVRALYGIGALTFPATFSFAAHHTGMGNSAALIAYLWSWLENQVMAALKAIPLGQSACQRMLAAIGAGLPGIARAAMQSSDDDLSNFAPGLAIASSRHETQYSRIFRS
jgi:urease accessory protein